jgi:hypothetical protein
MVRLQYDSSPAPVLTSFDSRGNLAATATLTIPGANRIKVSGFSNSPDGVLVLCGWSWDDQGRQADFIAFAGPDAPVQVIRTSPYSPHKITVASDGSLWTIGGEATPAGESKEDYKILRHYARNGNLLGAFVPRSTFKGTDWVDSGYLAATAERVGWYTGPWDGRGSEYLEVRADGTLLRVPGIDIVRGQRRVSGFALTTERAMVRTQSDQTGAVSIYSLELRKVQWEAVPIPPSLGKVGYLYGGDGDRIVTQGAGLYGIRFIRPAK